MPWLRPRALHRANFVRLLTKWSHLSNQGECDCSERSSGKRARTWWWWHVPTCNWPVKSAGVSLKILLMNTGMSFSLPPLIEMPKLVSPFLTTRTVRTWSVIESNCTCGRWSRVLSSKVTDRPSSSRPTCALYHWFFKNISSTAIRSIDLMSDRRSNETWWASVQRIWLIKQSQKDEHTMSNTQHVTLFTKLVI